LAWNSFSSRNLLGKLERRHYLHAQVFLFGRSLQNPVVTRAEEVGSRRFRAGQVQGIESPKSSLFQLFATIPYRVIQRYKIRRAFKDAINERPTFRL
jgi:hypothetical protein